jgi:hypothetical protein
MNKLPHFEPSPFLWNKIEAKIDCRQFENASPILMWSMGIVVFSLLVLSCLAPAAETAPSASAFHSFNALYHE